MVAHSLTSPCPAPTDPDAFWKEIRSYKNYMLIGSELDSHGIQIFDMRKVSSQNQTRHLCRLRCMY